MSNIAKILSEKLKNLRLDEEPFNLLYLLFQKVNEISGEEKGKRREEKLHSEMLAALLNPSKNGELGSLPIEVLLKELGLPEEKRNEFTVELEQYVKVDGRNRPIDILISWKGANEKPHAIIIENKIADAKDQNNQLNDYHKGLIKKRISVEKIIYITLTEGSKLPADARKMVRNKIEPFNTKTKIVHWLNKCSERLEKEKKSTVAIEQYKEFLESLTINKIKIMTTNQILSEMTLADVQKLEAIILSEEREWIDGKFKGITEELRKQFKADLKVTYDRKHDDLHRSFARYKLGENPKYWVEIWMDNDNMTCHVCSTEGKTRPLDIDGVLYSKNGDKDGGYYDKKKYYYYSSKEGALFNYPSKASDVDAKLLKTVASILQVLKKWK